MYSNYYIFEAAQNDKGDGFPTLADLVYTACIVESMITPSTWIRNT